MKKIYLFLIGLLALSGYSCQEETNPGGTAVQDMAGDWYVRLLFDQGNNNWQDGYEVGYQRFYTYNTNANLATEMFIDDAGHLWNFKGKVEVTLNDLSFKTSAEVPNLLDAKVPFKVIDGKIFPGGGKAISGTKTDSICMHIEFHDDPGTVYRICGIKRTGFPQDEP